VQGISKECAAAGTAYLRGDPHCTRAAKRGGGDGIRKKKKKKRFKTCNRARNRSGAESEETYVGTGALPSKEAHTEEDEGETARPRLCRFHVSHGIRNPMRSAKVLHREPRKKKNSG